VGRLAASGLRTLLALLVTLTAAAVARPAGAARLALALALAELYEGPPLPFE
jgi:hypothetical protein